MAALAVIASISECLRQISFDLSEDIRENFTIVPISGDHLEYDDVLDRFIHGQMNLAPSAALTDTALAILPFSFSK